MEVDEQKVTTDYVVDDWLRLHNLCFDTVRSALIKIQNFHRAVSALPPAPRNGLSVQLTFEDVWKLVAGSLSKQLPNLELEISQVTQGCKKKISFTSQNPPYTLIENDNDFPTIYMTFNGSAADILCVAHEFGHALQLHLADGHFIPPMYREIAAFLAESIFLEYVVEEIRPDLDIDIRAAWDSDNRLYFENDTQLLLNALHAPHITKYNYRHNYPLARSIAVDMKRAANADDAYLLFHGNSEAIKALVDAQLLHGGKEMQNYLPEIPEPEKNYPTINAYRSLGMMVLLDVDCWQGESEKTIEGTKRKVNQSLQWQSYEHNKCERRRQQQKQPNVDRHKQEIE